MKRIFTLLLLLALFAGQRAYAAYSEFPILVSEGMQSQLLYGQYYWDSPYYQFRSTINGVRITFLDCSDDTFNGYPIVALSQLEFYDYYGKMISYTVENISTNSLESTEGSLDALCDGSLYSYYHSAWSVPLIKNDTYVYLDVVFPTAVSGFRCTLISRNERTVPTSIAMTETGVGYPTTSVGGGGSGSTDGSTSGGSTGGGGSSSSSSSSLQAVDVLADSTLFVSLPDGGVDAYPLASIDGEYYTSGTTLYVPLVSGDIMEYAEGSYTGYSFEAPELPYMTSYKFNNKYNGNLNVDVIADTVTENMTFSLNAIGKSLTASFQLSDDRALAYIDTVLQESKVTRNRFDGPKQYIVTYPGYNVVANVKVQDELWSSTEDIVTEVPLTADMLATNKPSTHSDELVGSLLDNNSSTIFHSTWGSANNATLNVNCYITVDLPEALDKIRLYYMTRNSLGYNPLELEIYASNDKDSWTLVRTLTTDDGLPTSQALAEYTSPDIELGGSYSYLKIVQTRGEYSKNHMVWAEMRIYSVVDGTDEPEKIQDAEYAVIRMPFGRIYTVNTTWLTDGGQVPRIDIDIDGGYFVTSKEYYLNANFRITGYGVYDDFEDSVKVKGRGNSSWSYSKKPYRLKFSEKVKPFGLTKGKSWVLLANAQSGSMLANAIAMKIGQLVEAPYTNHIIPVELYMNGTYMGSYMFTEHVGISNNSVDIDDALGYMLELDSYYDETYKFRSTNYQLPVNIKDPDLSDYESVAAQTRKQEIMDDFNRLDEQLYQGYEVGDLVDLDALARFMFTNEFVLNQELGHPKSTFLWKENLSSPNSKIVFGPLWDFDWGFGYESNYNYFYSGATSSVLKNSMSSNPGYQFFGALMQGEQVKKHYYKVWNEFARKGHLQELIDFVQDYYNFARPSLENNYYKWYDGANYDANVTRAQAWLAERHDYLLNNLETFDLTEFLYPLLGDVNCDNALTVEDIALTVNRVLRNTHEDFNQDKADINNDLLITPTDVSHIASQVLAAESVSSLYYYNTPVAYAELASDAQELVPESNSNIYLTLGEYGTDSYSSLQMDVRVPSGLTLNDVVASARLSEHNFSYNQLSEDTYRVVVYSDTNSAFAAGDSLLHFTVYAPQEQPAEDIAVSVSNVLAVTTDNVEQRIDGVNIPLGYYTAVSEIKAGDATVRGGDCLTVTLTEAAVVDIYAVDGRLVRSVNASGGTTRIELPAGVYVVCGKKVVIK